MRWSPTYLCWRRGQYREFTQAFGACMIVPARGLLWAWGSGLAMPGVDPGVEIELDKSFLIFMKLLEGLAEGVGFEAAAIVEE